MKILDSDFLIAVLRKDPGAEDKMNELESVREPIATTVIAIQEVLVGVIDQPVQYEAARRFIDTLRVLDYDLRSVEHVAETIHWLRKHGRPIGIMDDIIGGICLSHGASIVTRNEVHFKEIPGLKIERW